MLVNDKGTAGDWNGYRYEIANVELYIEIMRDINNDIKDKHLRLWVNIRIWKDYRFREYLESKKNPPIFIKVKIRT